MSQLNPLTFGCLLAIAASACLDAKSGTTGSASDDAEADSTTNAADTGPGPAETSGPVDSSTPPDSVTPPPDAAEPPALLPPPGPWVRETIGNCIDFREYLSWNDDGVMTWMIDDDNACVEPAPRVITFSGSIRTVEPQVLELEFGEGDWPPASATWTWTIAPPRTPNPPGFVYPSGERLITTAYRRVGDDAFERLDHEVRGQSPNRSVRKLQVSIELPGYPDEVDEMRVNFDVSQRFGDGDRRGDDGSLTFAARRVETEDGRIAIAAEGYDPDSHPERYRFSQELLKDYDGWTVDLIQLAFFPVLFESPGGELYIESWSNTWYRAE